MTRKEAIERLTVSASLCNRKDDIGAKTAEAYDMAIKALRDDTICRKMLIDYILEVSGGIDNWFEMRADDFIRDINKMRMK